MEKIKFVWMLLLLPAVAQAAPESFNGSWRGKGTYVLEGVITQCREFQMRFSAGEGHFEFLSGFRKCDSHEEAFENVKMEARGGVLYFYGKKVGEYKENEMWAAYRAPEGGGRFRNWRMTMRRQGDHLVYEESRTMDGETTPMISFAGLMILER
jgi:hypothetical protein